ncbi:MAG: hypothetical protein ACJ74T_10185 [Pyrinomonadaceae bacterium]
MAFEHKHERLAPFGVFLRRWLRYIGFSLVMLAAALTLGMLGYHFIAEMPWVDSFLNASMILGGMGPVGDLDKTPNPQAAKLFAACYALFSGLVFVILMGIVLAPLAHRMLHKFHLAEEDLGG